jgi:multimeric flavodoxin WrbA
MRILAVNGAPRKKGHTEELLSLFCAGAESVGGEVSVVNLVDYDIQPCHGCYHCWTDGNASHTCVIEDQMSEIIEQFYQSEALILATPVYFHTLSALLKRFIERLLPLLKPELVEGRLGVDRIRLRDPGRGPKRSVLIAAAGQRDIRGMAPIVPTFKLIADNLETEPVGELLRTESFFTDFSLASPRMRRDVGQVVESFRQAGVELVTQGRIRTATQEAASRPLTQDPELFNHHFAAYWQIAGELKKTGTLRKTIRSAVRQDLRFLIPNLAECYDAKIGGDLEAVFQFNLQGKQTGVWHLAISRGNCRAFPKTHDAPDVTVEASSDVLVSILTDRREPLKLQSQNKLRVKGNQALFERFAELFSL